jgi:hypothetical protein
LAEESIFAAMRPVVLNGIEDLLTRQDLVDRAVVLHLPVLAESDRRTEAELGEDFRAARPRILGALLDAVSAALANLPSTRLDCKPRMADFATWVVAAEPALPWPPGAFLTAYERNRTDVVKSSLEADPVAVALLVLVRKIGSWEGTLHRAASCVGAGRTRASPALSLLAEVGPLAHQRLAPGGNLPPSLRGRARPRPTRAGNGTATGHHRCRRPSRLPLEGRRLL